VFMPVVVPGGVLRSGALLPNGSWMNLAPT
jgi:hypothetical protein